MFSLAAYTLTLVFALSAGAQTLENTKVTDAASLDKCFHIQPYARGEEIEKTKTGELIDEEKISVGCINKAKTLAGTKSTIKEVEELADVVSRNSNWPSAFRIYHSFITGKKKLDACDSIEMYKAMKEALDHPADYPSKYDSFSSLAYAVMDFCMKSGDFKKDIEEDSQSSEGYLAKNICSYLKSKKIANKCK